MPVPRIIIFSGAGLSADSGLATFRDNKGLWAQYDPMEVCNFYNWEKNYDLVHTFYNQRRKELKDIQPNEAHHIMRQLETNYNTIHITQNVDNLLERSGCQKVIHLHGQLTELICPKCTTIDHIGYTNYVYHPCKKCGNPRLKPNVVFFNEIAPLYTTMYHIFSTVQEKDTILIVGTSGNVIDVHHLLHLAKGKGYKILNNSELSPSINEYLFDEYYFTSASIALPQIYQNIQKRYSPLS